MLAACGGEIGRGEQLARADSAIRGLAVDPSGLYAVTVDNQLLQIRSGSGAQVLYAGHPSNDDGAAPVPAGAALLWLDSTAPELEATLKTGAATTTLATGVAMHTLAADDTSVYWASETDPYSDAIATTVHRADFGGAHAATLATVPATVHDLRVEGDRVYLLEIGPAPYNARVQSMFGDGSDLRTELEPGSPDFPVLRGELPALATWNGGLYWSLHDGSVHRTALDSRQTATVMSVRGTVRWIGADALGVMAVADECATAFDEYQDAYTTCTSRVYSAGAVLAESTERSQYSPRAQMRPAFDSDWIYWAPPLVASCYACNPPGAVFRIERPHSR